MSQYTVIAKFDRKLRVENLLHLLAKQDEYQLIESFLAKTKESYIACPSSPLEVAEAQAAKSLLSVYKSNNEKKNWKLFSQTTLNDIEVILKLTGGVVCEFFDSFTLEDDINFQ